MTPEQAIALVREQKLVPFTDVPGAPRSFVRAVAGGPVRGSWWAHPRSNEIWNLGQAVLATGEVLSLKLAGGKETFLHRTLWPALARVVTDEGFRAARLAGLSRPARELLREVERSKGPLRLDELAERKGLATKASRRALAKARLELERGLLVRADEVHTESGSHASVLEPWSRWATPEVRTASARLSLEEALAALGAESVNAPRRAPAPGARARPRARARGPTGPSRSPRRPRGRRASR